ncbi:RNA polymerase sigma factor [Novosphingobium pentaromativorans]|uniref:RNA polymerase sigma-70 factor, ECF subfamily n=1 Tax=Novosphingobium pentaromativorans US6-1 TaxID=1088721 RepID=G6EGW1_9SPHN|nr:RNA polymerase sigma factor [Novosphingobium pentaromativorans]AIT82047.1 RNA polymerase subunit sigma-70 [Novosphingobium pentaromativorans US6-1]EHJ59250.1 RNA polymerase sigma-70 factor, ECF subfamily [Novosphingobium pentaromativorans US6-1]
MTSQPLRSGLESAFLENRDKLLKFLRARGAGDAAEDIVQEVWVKITTSRPGPVASPLSYLYRTADLLMIDRYRSRRQAEKRDRDWSDVHAAGDGAAASEPSPERRVAAAQEAGMILHMLEGLGPRAVTVFRKHRIDGTAQKEIALELGVSLSTVESDLRGAYRAISEWKETRDEA